RLRPPAPPPGWRVDDRAEVRTAETWAPVFVGADRTVDAVYRAGARSVRLVIAFYGHQRQGAKAVSSLNRIADDELWTRVATDDATVVVDGVALSVPSSRLTAGGERRLAWSWYWIGGHVTANPVEAKLIQLRATLVEQQRSAAAIALSAPYA